MKTLKHITTKIGIVTVFKLDGGGILVNDFHEAAKTHHKSAYAEYPELPDSEQSNGSWYVWWLALINEYDSGRTEKNVVMPKTKEKQCTLFPE